MYIHNESACMNAYMAWKSPDVAGLQDRKKRKETILLTRNDTGKRSIFVSVPWYHHHHHNQHHHHVFHCII